MGSSSRFSPIELVTGNLPCLVRDGPDRVGWKDFRVNLSLGPTLLPVETGLPGAPLLLNQ